MRKVFFVHPDQSAGYAPFSPQFRAKIGRKRNTKFIGISQNTPVL